MSSHVGGAPLKKNLGRAGFGCGRGTLENTDMNPVSEFRSRVFAPTLSSTSALSGAMRDNTAVRVRNPNSLLSHAKNSSALAATCAMLNDSKTAFWAGETLRVTRYDWGRSSGFAPLFSRAAIACQNKGSSILLPTNKVG